MFVLSLVFVTALTPSASLKLAQAETQQQTARQKANIQKAKTDLKAKIYKVKKEKKSVLPGGLTDKQLDKILDRLNEYLKYLDYLAENPSLATSDKLLNIDAATDNILNVLDKIVFDGASIIFSSGDFFDNFDAVTQSDIGLTYNPAIGSIASGLIGTGGDQGTGDGSDAGDAGGDSPGGDLGGDGGSDGGSDIGRPQPASA